MLHTAPDLTRVRRNAAEAELKALEQLRLAIAGSVDLGAVQRRIVTALTAALGFDEAMVGLVDPGQLMVGEWIGARRRGRPALSRLDAIPLRGGGPLVAAFARPGHPVRGTIGGRDVAMVALQYRGQPVGVLAVTGPDGCLGADGTRVLERFAVHAAEALAGVRLCVDRAQRLAVEAERNRISVEMHDAVIQSLFAINQSLAGCAGLVERGDARALAEVNRVQSLTAKTLEQLRRSIHDIWPGELLERQFVADLREHVGDLVGPGTALEVQVDVSGHLGSLSPSVRRALFRVAQESLNNVVKHAAASKAAVHLDASGDPVRLTVGDDGRGMPAGPVESSIGIAGMRARLAALAGSLDILSEAGRGTTVVASIPRESACRLG